MLLQKSSFSSNLKSSIIGRGALRIEESDTNKLSSNYFKIEDCLFSNNSNVNGGAI